MGHNTTTADAASRIVRTPSAAASALGIDRGTLYEWFRKGCPREEGRFDVDAIAAWRETTLRPATNEARRREPRAQVPGPIHDVVEVAMRFARDLVSPDGAFTKLLSRLPRATREHLAVDAIFFLFCTVEEFASIDKAALFDELGLADAFAVYYETHEKLGLNLHE